MAMGEQASAHVLVVSFPSQGHVNPLLRLAKRIASKGLFVTFSSSSDVGHRIHTLTNSRPCATIPVGSGHLRFEFFYDGWDHDDPRPSQIDDLMANIRTTWPPAVADLIRRQAVEGRPVTCVINNPFLPWLLDVAADMSIPSALLWVQSCAVYSTYYHYHHSIVEFPTADRPDVSVTLPGLPTLKPDELPTFLLESNPYKCLTDVILQQFQNLHKASWVFGNSFEELERDAIRAISELSPIIPIGPLVDEPGSNIRGDLWRAADCMEWLDAQEPLSVVYVSVGSVLVLSREEMEEIAHGLRNTGRPFLWVVRESCQELLPKGFVEGTEGRGRGMVVGWSPQERVLAHGSVACFVTHCGWNSTLEALNAGVPVVAYPQLGDLVPDAKFLVDVYRVGVRLGAPVGREEMASCVQEVTTGPAAEELRRRAMGWKEVARASVTDGGSSDVNIQAFVDDIRKKTIYRS